MLGLLLLGTAHGVLNDGPERRQQEAQNASNLKTLALQAKREEMRQFLLARGLLATEDILDKFRY
jgi:hypothetical protein